MSQKGNLENMLGAGFSVDGKSDERLIQIDAPEQVFEKSFSQEVLDKAKAKAPQYRQMSGRPDPFDKERMLQSVGSWSTLIHKSLITFSDACDHAVELCKLWAEEDKDLELITIQREQLKVERQAVAKTNILVEGTKEYEVEQARIAWREAVRQRNELMRQWDDYVKKMRDHYRALRDS